MKVVKVVLIVLVLIGEFGCSAKPPGSRRTVGKIIRVESVCGSFNEADRSRIITEQASVVVFGNASLPVGKEGMILNGRYFGWEGQDPGVMSYRLAD